MSSKVVYYDVVPSPAKSESPESDDVEEMMIAKRGGCCSWIPCFGSDPAKSPDGSWERIRNDGPWWARGWRKIREWSELVAGTKWKTFIRRFNKNGGGNKRGGGAKFQYDPMSYSRNFDEGPGQNGDFDEGYLYRDFSSRYASVPASAKSSMDLGKDAPSFT